MADTYIGQVQSPLGNFVNSLQKSLEQERQNKLALAQTLIQSGQYRPAVTQQPQSLLGRIGGDLFGPQVGGQNMNVMGQNYQRVNPDDQINNVIALADKFKALGNTGLSPEFKTSIPGVGDVAFKKNTALTPEDAVALYQRGKEAMSKAGVDGADFSVSATGKPSVKRESAWTQRIDISKQAAPKVFDMVRKGQVQSYLKSDPQTKAMVNQMASDAGINMDTAIANNIEMNQKARTSGSPQITRFLSAESSLNKSLDVLDKLNEEYTRSNVVPNLWNRVKIAYDTQVGDDGKEFKRSRFVLGDKSELSNTQQQLAQRYLSQLNFAKDMLATVYSGGYAAQDWAFKMADQSINPYLGPKAQQAASSQIRVEMGIRRKGLADALNRGRNQFDDLSDSQDEGSADNNSGGGDYQQYLQSIGGK